MIFLKKEFRSEVHTATKKEASQFRSSCGVCKYSQEGPVMSNLSYGLA